MQRENLWVSGAKAVFGALVATLAVRWVAVATLDIPPEFLPLDGPGPVIFFTTVSAVGAVAVYGIVRRVALRPDFAFRIIAGVVLVLSIMPDLWLLTDGAAEVFPGATHAAVTVLIVLHVAAAITIVWVLTGGDEPRVPGDG
jgi:hypothetical protein